MEEIRDFESFYTSRIEPVLGELKTQDKEADNSGILMFVFLVITLVCFIVNINGGMPGYGTPLCIVLLIVTIFYIHRYTQKDDGYRSGYKQAVIGEIIKYLQPTLVYKPDEFIASGEYRRSSLFRHYFDYYDGDDYIEGVYKNVSFRCCELLTRYDRGGRGISGGLATIFKGLFFVAKVSDDFKGGTYVWATGLEQLGNSIADERYRLLPIPKVYEMNMGDAEFEKYFFVCSSYPDEARKILDQGMMDRMVRFRKQINRRFVMSVVAGYCYVAVPIDEDLLEPADDPGDKEAIKQYFFTILLILSIINQLELGKLT